MTDEEKAATVRNVISDLESALRDLEDGELTYDSFWEDCQLAAECITEERANL